MRKTILNGILWSLLDWRFAKIEILAKSDRHCPQILQLTQVCNIILLLTQQLQVLDVFPITKLLNNNDDDVIDGVDDAAASIDDGGVFWECVSSARDRDRVGGKHISVSRVLHMVVGDDAGAGDGGDDE